jgi:hypothetical protein
MGKIGLAEMPNKFIKSATYGQPYTERTKRLLTLFLFSFWGIGFIYTTAMVYSGISAIPLYFKAKELMKTLPDLERFAKQEEENRRNYAEYERIVAEHYTKTSEKEIQSTTPGSLLDAFNDSDSNRPDTNSGALEKRRLAARLAEMKYGVHISIPFNGREWEEVGISNPDPSNTDMPYTAILIQENEIYKIGWIAIYILMAFVAPWLLIRLVFWIKTADKVKRA